jgi:hypothetical protein
MEKINKGLVTVRRRSRVVSEYCDSLMDQIKLEIFSQCQNPERSALLLPISGEETLIELIANLSAVCLRHAQYSPRPIDRDGADYQKSWREYTE